MVKEYVPGVILKNMSEREDFEIPLRVTVHDVPEGRPSCTKVTVTSVAVNVMLIALSDPFTMMDPDFGFAW